MDLFWLYKILLVFTHVELLFRQRNSFVEEGFFQGLRGKSPFRFKLATSINLCNFWPRLCSCLGSTETSQRRAHYHCLFQRRFRREN